MWISYSYDDSSFKFKNYSYNRNNLATMNAVGKHETCPHKSELI